MCLDSAGTEVTITWSVKGIPTTDTVNIELNSHRTFLNVFKLTHLTVAKAAPNTGSFKWIVPSDGNPKPGDGYFFTVSWTADKGINDETGDCIIMARYPFGCGWDLNHHAGYTEEGGLLSLSLVGFTPRSRHGEVWS